MKTQLLLLHGALGTTLQFKVLKEKLWPLYDVFDFNFSGHGSNNNGNDFSIDLFSANTLEYLNEHHLEKVNIFGYSMGGYVGLQFARDHPGRVNKIITLATKFDWNPDTAAKEARMLIPENIEEKIPKFAEELQRRHEPNDWKSIVRKTSDMMTALGNGKAMNMEDFETIVHHVLICIGDEDKMVSISESERVVHHLKNGTLKIIPGFKHPIETNDPDVLSALIQDFINGKTRIHE